MDEHDSEVERELHRKLLTLVHQDAASELDKLLRSLCLESDTKLDGTDNLITPSTWFVRRAKRNLLHLCAYLQAPKCVRLLIQPPYSWDPDQPDRVNRTPLHLAETRDDLVTLYELVHVTREQRKPSQWPLTRPELDGLPSACLFWPQQLLVFPMPLSALKNRTKGISGCWKDMEMQYVYRTSMIGPLLALIFELYVATPELFAFDLWTGEDVVSGTEPRPIGSDLLFQCNRFWPIPPSDRCTETVDHVGCTIYPHCLYQIAVRFRDRAQSPSDTLGMIRNRWLMHRFGDPDHFQGGWSPFSLKDYCRAAIRRTLVQRCVPHTRQNYAQLIAQLNLPMGLRVYLLYRDIWDTDNFEPYLTGGYGGNVPLGIPLDASRIQDENGESGLLIGHRFIPDRTPDSAQASFVTNLVARHQPGVNFFPKRR